MNALDDHKPDRSLLWIALSGFVTLLMALVLSLSPFLSRLLAIRTLTITPGSSQNLAPIQVQPTAIGALRIDIAAQPQQNRWVSYEVQVRDAQNILIASAVKDAWTESGDEDGEVWSESNLESEFDLKTNQAETLSIAIRVLEHTDVLGQDVAEPVSFNISVRNGVTDNRFFWAGLIGTGALTLIAIRLRTQEF